MSDTINVSVGSSGVAYAPKQRITYILIAVLVPVLCCGIVPPLHNFYAGHTSKGILQLAIWGGNLIFSTLCWTVLSFLTLGISSIVATFVCPIVAVGLLVWCIIDAIIVDTDGNGVPMQ